MSASVHPPQMRVVTASPAAELAKVIESASALSQTGQVVMPCLPCNAWAEIHVHRVLIRATPRGAPPGVGTIDPVMIFTRKPRAAGLAAG
ncbi:MAG: hypothetical protein IPN32_39005 [Deltaproteobacteria bacterium]|nr:hypothetical protein [Deltaproteobacteria bacterium]